MVSLNEHFKAQFLKFLNERGLTLIEPTLPDETFQIYREDEYVCSIESGGEIRYKVLSEDQQIIQKFFEDNFQLYILCEHFPRMPFDSVSEYAKFYEIGNTVMGAKILSDHRIEFATWEYDYERKGVIWGHYWNDYKAAKEDFAIRSGLIDKRRIFSSEQLAILHEACLFQSLYDTDLTFKKEKGLYEMVERLEELRPSLHLEPEMKTNELQEEELNEK